MEYNFDLIQEDSKRRIAFICKSINHMLNTCEINGLGYLTSIDDVKKIKILFVLLNSELALYYIDKSFNQMNEFREFIINRYFMGKGKYIMTYDTLYFAFRNID